MKQAFKIISAIFLSLALLVGPFAATVSVRARTLGKSIDTDNIGIFVPKGMANRYADPMKLSRRGANPIRLKTNILRTLLCFQPCHTSVCLRLQATQCTQNIRFQVLRSFKRKNFCRDKKESGKMLTHFEHF